MGALWALHVSPAISFITFLILTLTSCAGSSAVSQQTIADDLNARAGATTRLGEGIVALPPGVIVADDASEGEVVALALWNNPEFQASLAELDISRADLFTAQMLANPNLTLLDPVGPGLLEGMVAIPINLLRRPQRVAAAKRRLEQSGQLIVQTGLTLARDVRLQVAALEQAKARAALLAEDEQAAAQLATLAARNEAAGRGTGLESATAAAAAADIAAALIQARNDAQTAQLSLNALAGTPLEDVTPSPIRLGDIPAPDVLAAAAAQTRPDLRAAELEIEAAERDMSLAGIDVLQPSVLVDLGKDPGQSVGVTVGGSVNLPIFNQGQDVRLRAKAAYARALANRDQVALLIEQQVRTAQADLAAARHLLTVIEADLLPAASRRLSAAQSRFEYGRVPIVEVVLARRDLIAARLQRVDGEATWRRARADLRFALGRDVFAPAAEKEKP